MLREVTLPEISENVDSGEVIAVLVSVGDVVEKDQPVVELETEKAAFEVPSPSRGRIAEIDVKVGQTVKVGQVLAKLQTDGEFIPGPKPGKASARAAGDRGGGGGAGHAATSGGGGAGPCSPAATAGPRPFATGN